MLIDQNHGVDELQQYLFEADAAVIKSFVRELTTQSIIPFMEGRVIAWNDQVASRRRGLSGRFMSLSKRWTAFGSGRGSKTGSSYPGGSNYDANAGIYFPDSPEATLHRLAYYAFMLRDWKLSASIYDLLRADFVDDKAWRHAALANEMAALSLLFVSQTDQAFKSNIDTINQMLDSASYSFLSRCSDPMGTLRCLVLAIGLFSARGDAGRHEASRWAIRLLENSILNPLPQCILSEQLAWLFQSRSGVGDLRWSSRNRKAALWHFLTTHMWLVVGKLSIAAERLGDAKMLYATSMNSNETPPFAAMVGPWEQLHERITPNNTDIGPEDLTRGAVEEDEEHGELRDNNETRAGQSTAALIQQVERKSLYHRLHNSMGHADDGFT